MCHTVVRVRTFPDDLAVGGNDDTAYQRIWADEAHSFGRQLEGFGAEFNIVSVMYAIQMLLFEQPLYI